ncbi:hypothetical protein [Herbidospora mongoliensis]|uniref:hypothetical protein n=1 Tax=Herbidospora mongoliensis TaxID=688067 RepID=UPI000A7CAC5B|nr:hypothetical protein [Herbidospora mongoliensis]
MTDDELEAELQEVAAMFDPPPVDLVQVAVDAFALHNLDGELAALAFDSLDEPELVRGQDARLLTFTAPGLTIEVELDGGRLLGQLLPPQEAEIVVNGRPPVRADDLGRFAADEVAAGSLSLRCELAGRTVVTEWLTV